MIFWLIRQITHLHLMFISFIALLFAESVYKKIQPGMVYLLSATNLWYHKFQNHSYMDLYKKCSQEGTAKIYLIFLARNLEIFEYLSSYYYIPSNFSDAVDSYESSLNNNPNVNFTQEQRSRSLIIAKIGIVISISLAKLLAYFIALKPAIYGYDKLESRKLAKPSSKTSSGLNLSLQQKSQQQPASLLERFQQSQSHSPLTFRKST